MNMATTTKTAIRVGVGVWDLHYPEHDEKLWHNILRTIKILKPDYFIFGGDNMNMNAVDLWLHEKGLVRQLEGKRILEEYKGFEKHVLKPLEDLLPKECRKIWLTGNHEDWINLAIDRNPQGEGYWEIERNLELSEHNWEVYETGQVAKIGKVYFAHGQYTNQYHARKTVEVYERNIVYSHTHTYQVYVKTSAIDNEPHIGMCVPVACKRNPDYKRNQPNSWVNGFLVFYIQENGNFNLYPVVSVKNHFVLPNGKVL